MNVIKLVFKNEMTLLYRNKFLIIPLVIIFISFLAIIIKYEIDIFNFNTRGESFFNAFQWILLVNLLFLGLFATYFGSKDREMGFENLIVTYKIKNSHWLVGKWLVVQFYGACFTFITLIIQIIWFVSGGMNFNELPKNILYTLFQMEGSIFLTISIGFLAGTLIQNIISYLLMPVILGWMAYIQLSIDEVNPRWRLLLSYDALHTNSAYKGIWGIQRVLESVIFHQVGILLLALIILLATILIYHPKRSTKKEKIIVATILVVISIPALIISEQQYKQYNSAYKSFLDTGKYYLLPIEEDDTTFYKNGKDQIKSNFSMEFTDLVITFIQEDSLSVISDLTVRNNSEEAQKEFHVTLHHGLKVTDCYSEKEVSCTRENDYLKINVKTEIQPEQELNLKLNYNGNIKQFRNGTLEKQSFINGNGIYLPKEAGWYPLIGKRKLAISQSHNNIYSNFEIRNGKMVEDNPTEFSIQIVDTYDIPIAMTIPKVENGKYKGLSQYGLSVMGGNLSEKEVGSVRVISHPDVLNSASHTVTLFLDKWKATEKWLGVPVVPKVIYIIDSDLANLTQQNTDFIVWDSYVLANINRDNSLMAYYTASTLVEEFNMDFDYNDLNLLRDVLVWELQKHFNIESEFKSFQEKINDTNPYMSPKDKNTINIIDQYEQKGEEDLSILVKYLYLQYRKTDEKLKFDLKESIKKYEKEVRDHSL